MGEHEALLIGTRKGAFVCHGDSERRLWRLEGPHFLGQVVNHMVLDPRDGKTILMGARTGHLGPTVFRSTDMGRTWTEATKPPAFAKVDEADKGRAVENVFWLTPDHPSHPGCWWASTSPAGLFHSEDGGVSWRGVTGFNDRLLLDTIAAAVNPVPGTGGSGMNSIAHSPIVDSGDARHIYVSISVAGIFESRDRGETWRPLNQGVAADFIPTPDPEYGHDPHSVRIHPQRPTRLYQSNHCGFYRIDRPADRWERIGRNLPTAIGDISFAHAIHPRDPDTVWIFPMDGTTVWPRTSPDGKPAVYRSRDAGRTFIRQDRGLPPEQGWFTVKRQAFDSDDRDPVGLYFGTTGGEIWMSDDEGENWRSIVSHLPEVLSVTTARFAD